MLILNKVTLSDWREGIRGRFSQNLKVLPVLKLSIKPNKLFECLNKENSKKKKDSTVQFQAKEDKPVQH